LDEHVNSLSGLSKELAALLKETPTPFPDAPQNASIDKVDRETVDPNEQLDEADRS